MEMDAALAVAAEYATTGYDAQYVVLAQSLNAPLITEDRKPRKAVPGIAFSMQEFWRSNIITMATPRLTIEGSSDDGHSSPSQ